MPDDPERDLLNEGRDILRRLRELSGDDPDKLAHEIQQLEASSEHLAAGVYAALVDGVEPNGEAAQRAAGRATGPVAAGVLAGGSDTLGVYLYKAARASRDVHAVERSADTGDPAYVERRAKNVLVGRLLGKAGVWRRLWK